ncbi:RecQ family ATP-dependent DNA helicase [Amnibacterium kyonggiense]|uniref:DNA 3'-5' helicase n=1 Tax=Amnibacterium kyonggiense TaxID=595671 RepID=A0A4R7FMD7_9MICO|nr:DEAD/DEAH box helicase [Amnibacterium kyonggiense]TDS77632.1 RecQ-like ATP-dependent DNA helicase [Amnibacterium kyonggiense]
MTDTRTDTRAAALDVLRTLVGRPDADFHDGQYDAIEAIVDDARRALVVQRTGWGKSAVYFVATKLLRDRGAGPTLLVSPLLALMRDQVAAAARAGVLAASIDSANQHLWDEVRERLDRDEIDVLLVSPERLNNPDFRDGQLPGLIERTGLIVIDEAHCISDWGHDFRPDYRRLRDLVAAAGSTPVLATTATANGRVVADVAAQLGGPDEVLTIRGPLARASLRLGVLRTRDQATRLGWLVEHLRDLQGSGIVYALTVSAAEDTARLLREAGYDVLAYTGKTENAERETAEQALKENRVKALVATSALGMGFDKPDLGFVVHLGAPSSPVAYYQQVGRAGRATDSADVLLLPGAEDEAIWSYFATASMPTEEQAAAVLRELDPDRPLSTPALEALVDVKRSRLELLLKVLDVDGAVRRVRGGWVATGEPWTYDAERYERIAEARRAEQQHMLDYEALPEGPEGCRMAYLQRVLDDPSAAPCGRCDRCTSAWYPAEVSGDAAGTAGAALQRVGVAIEARKQWPTGAESRGLPVKGNIAVGERPEEGRAIARLTDLGWGGTLRRLLAPGTPDAEVPRPVVDAAVQVLRAWDWAERPVGVVAMPSHGHPRLVDSTARALSEIGRLPLLGALEAATSGPPEGAGGASLARLAGVWSAFRVPDDLRERLTASTGPVLLVDDAADSRWTFTVAARLLRQAGAPGVLPFALALQA